MGLIYNPIHNRKDNNEITIIIIRCSNSTSKFDYCISYITHDSFNTIIVFKYNNDIWGVAES